MLPVDRHSPAMMLSTPRCKEAWIMWVQPLKSDNGCKCPVDNLTRQWQLLTCNNLHKFSIHRKDETCRIKQKTCRSDLTSLCKWFICYFSALAVIQHVIHTEALYRKFPSYKNRQNKGVEVRVVMGNLHHLQYPK